MVTNNVIWTQILFHWTHTAEDIETSFDTSNYELDRPMSKNKNLKNNWVNER